MVVQTQTKTHAVSVEVPVGMTSEKLLKVLETFGKQNATRQEYNEARRKALSTLAKKYDQEFKYQLARELKALRANGSKS